MQTARARADEHNHNRLDETVTSARLLAELERCGLARELAPELLRARPHLFSAVPVYVAQTDLDRVATLARAIDQVVSTPVFEKLALKDAPAVAQHPTRARGVFFGYDVHLSADGPKLIEINTNAGGAMLNLCLARAYASPEAGKAGLALDAEGLGRLEDELVGSLLCDWRLERGEAPLGVIAIVDETPAEQYLYPEFLLFRAALERRGVETVLLAPSELVHRDGGLWAGARRVDLIYNRLTDFYFQTPACEALAHAYLRDEVVITPHPRAHALYANKQNLARLSSEEVLRSTGVDEDVVRAVLAGVPRTQRLEPAHADELWANRKRWFFKPAGGYGGKAAYRGDKLTRGTWAQIVGKDYVAQEFIPPSERCVLVGGVSTPLKLDLRAFTYGGAVQLFAARLYQGQTTNFRTPGGGFAAVFSELD